MALWIVEVPQWCRSRRIRWYARTEKKRKKERRKKNGEKDKRNEEAETATSKGLLRFRSTTFSLAGTLQFSSANSNDYWICFVTRKIPRKFREAFQATGEKMAKMAIFCGITARKFNRCKSRKFCRNSSVSYWNFNRWISHLKQLSKLRVWWQNCVTTKVVTVSKRAGYGLVNFLWVSKFPRPSLFFRIGPHFIFLLFITDRKNLKRY